MRIYVNRNVNVYGVAPVVLYKAICESETSLVFVVWTPPGHTGAVRSLIFSLDISPAGFRQIRPRPSDAAVITHRERDTPRSERI